MNRYCVALGRDGVVILNPPRESMSTFDVAMLIAWLKLLSPVTAAELAAAELAVMG